jgi:predicted 3-demethylubiquinone-9 3-methyltransferase (glyoxalase superfamily)
MVQKIIPHLWFDKEAADAAAFYASVFDNSRVVSHSIIKDTPSGDCDILTFDVRGFRFMAISAGPMFKPNPSISFMVNYDPARGDTKLQLDTAWAKLSEGGKIMMPLQEYPFSKHYGWVEDKFGVSWQLMLTDPTGEPRPTIVPSLMFVGKNCGKAEEATDQYISVFSGTRGTIARYPAGMEPDKEGTIMYTDFAIAGQWFASMDSAHKHEFQFSEGVSLIIKCKDQAEIDYFWDKLSAVPEAEQCGWVKDQYGVSWQIQPENMDELLARNLAKTTPAMLNMKKIVIAELEAAGKE